jgi:hypothetical protein
VIIKMRLTAKVSRASRSLLAKGYNGIDFRRVIERERWLKPVANG